MTFMNRLAVLFSLFLWASCSLAQSFDANYILGAGDKVKIQVFGEEDLTVESLVGDAGNVPYPFLGDVPVKGRTVSDIQQHIYSALKGSYLVEPEVTVSIIEYRQFFVNGYVEKPGGFPFQPGMTVRKAISLAGGFKERANRKRINLLDGDDPSAEPQPVRLDDSVRPGDIVTIERSFF